MDDADTRITIGALGRLTGLPVRTLRFYSDSGLVATAGRSAAGYRLYDAGAAARVELVRTLRELGSCTTSPASMPTSAARSSAERARMGVAAGGTSRPATYLGLRDGPDQQGEQAHAAPPL